MAVPKKKQTRTRTHRRKARWLALESPNVYRCPNCGSPKLPHFACPHCGFYKGTQRVTIKIKEEKKE